MAHPQHLKVRRKSRRSIIAIICSSVLLLGLFCCSIVQYIQTRNAAIAEILEKVQAKVEVAHNLYYQADTNYTYTVAPLTSSIVTNSKYSSVLAKQSVIDQNSATELTQEVESRVQDVVAKASDAQEKADVAPDYEPKEEALTQATIANEEAANAQAEAKNAKSAASETKSNAQKVLNSATEVQVAKNSLQSHYNNIHSINFGLSFRYFHLKSVALVRAKLCNSIPEAEEILKYVTSEVDNMLNVVKSLKNHISNWKEAYSNLITAHKNSMTFEQDTKNSLSKIFNHLSNLNVSITKSENAVDSTLVAVDEAYAQEEAEKQEAEAAAAAQVRAASYFEEGSSNGIVLTRSAGRIQYNGHDETWYSQSVLPGGGLDIPGRHVDEQGLIRDADGYICVASMELSKGTIVETSLGMGKVYDYCEVPNTIDIYTDW